VDENYSTWRICTVGITKHTGRRFVSLTFAQRPVPQPEDYELCVEFCQRMLVQQRTLHGMLISDKIQFNYDRINNSHEILTCGRPTIFNGLIKEPYNINTYWIFAVVWLKTCWLDHSFWNKV
jgi:hypothetical protein